MKGCVDMNYRYHYSYPCKRPSSNGSEEIDNESVDSENRIRIETTINLTQNANGGDGGDGGDGGSTGEIGDITGGAAASATATDGFAIAINSELENETADTEDLVTPLGLNNLPEPINGEPPVDGILENPTVDTSTGGNAIGPDAGDGGNGSPGGNGGTNNATIVAENIFVVKTNGDGVSPPPLALGLNNRQIDITTDENGNTLVNGQKMAEETLGDGTKVFIFRNTL